MVALKEATKRPSAVIRMTDLPVQELESLSGSGQNGDHRDGGGNNNHKDDGNVGSSSFFPPNYDGGSKKYRIPNRVDENVVIGSNGRPHWAAEDVLVPMRAPKVKEEGLGQKPPQGIDLETEKKPETFLVADWYSDETVEVSEEEYEAHKYKYLRVQDDEGNDLPLARKEARLRNDVVDVILPVAALLPEGVRVRAGKVVVVKTVVEGSDGDYYCVATADNGGEAKKLARVMHTAGGNDVSVHDGNFTKQEDRIRLLSDVVDEVWEVDDSDDERQRVAVGALNKTLEVMRERKIRNPNEIDADDVVHVLYDDSDIVAEKPPFVLLAGTPTEPVIRLFRTHLISNDDGVLVSVEVTTVDFDANTHEMKSESKCQVNESGNVESLEPEMLYPPELMSELLSKINIEGEMSMSDYDAVMDDIKVKTDKIQLAQEQQERDEIAKAAEAEEKRITEEMEAVEAKKQQDLQEMADKVAESVVAMAVDAGLTNVRELPMNDSLSSRIVKVLSVEDYSEDEEREYVKVLSVELLNPEQKLVNGEASKWVGETGLVDRVIMRQNEDGEWETFFAKDGKEVKLSRVQRFNILADLTGVRALDENNPITGNVVETIEEETGKKTWRATLESGGNDIEIVRTEEGGVESYKVVLNGVETALEKGDWYYLVVEKMHGLMTGKYWFEKDGNINDVGSKIKRSDGRRRTLTWEDKFIVLGSTRCIDKEFADKMFFGALAEVLEQCSDPESVSRPIPINELAGKFAANSKDVIGQMEIVDGLIRDLRSAAIGGRNSGYFFFDRVEIGNLKKFDYMRMPIHYGEKGGKQFFLEIGGEAGLSVYTNRKEETYEYVEGRKHHWAWKAFNWWFGKEVVDEQDRKEKVTKVERVGIHPVLERVFLGHMKSPLGESEDTFNAKRIAVIREFYDAKAPGVYKWSELADFKVRVGQTVVRTSTTSTNNLLINYEPETAELAKQRYVVIGTDGKPYVLRHLSELRDDQKRTLFPEAYNTFVKIEDRPVAPNDAWVVEYGSEVTVTVVHPQNPKFRADADVKVLKGRAVPSISGVVNLIDETDLPVLMVQPGGVPESLDIDRIAQISKTGFGGVALWQENADTKVNWSAVAPKESTKIPAPKANVKGAKVQEGGAEAGGGWKAGVEAAIAKQTKFKAEGLMSIASDWSTKGETVARQQMTEFLQQFPDEVSTLRPLFDEMMGHIFPKNAKIKTPPKAATQTIPAAKAKKTAAKPQEKAAAPLTWDNTKVQESIIKSARAFGEEEPVLVRMEQVMRSLGQGETFADIIKGIDPTDQASIKAAIYLKNIGDRDKIGVGKKTEAAAGNNLNVADVGSIDFNDVQQRAKAEGYGPANMTYLMMAHAMLREGSQSYEELLRDSEGRDPGLNKAFKDLAKWYPAK